MVMASSGVTVHGTGQHVTLVQPAGPPDTALAVLTSVTHSGTAGPAGDTRRCVRYVRATLRLETTCWSRPLTPLAHSRPLLPPGGGGRGRSFLSARPPLVQPAPGGRATQPPPHHTHLLPPMYHTRTPPRKPLTPSASTAHTTHPPLHHASPPHHARCGLSLDFLLLHALPCTSSSHLSLLTLLAINITPLPWASRKQEIFSD